MATTITTKAEAVDNDPSIAISTLADQTAANTKSVGPGRTLDSLEIDEPTSNEPIYPQGGRFWGIVFSQVIVLILGGLDNNIVATAVPALTDYFQTNADIGWYASAFRLTTCASQFIWAKLYRLFPLKPVWISSIIIFMIGSVLCAAATTSAMFIAGRAVTGLAFAGVLSGCFAALNVMLPLPKRPIFAGVMASVESCAIISAPIVGGAIVQSLGWQWCFWISLPIAGLALISTIIFFTSPPQTAENDMDLRTKLAQLDIVSNCLIIPGLTALFLAFSWAGTKYAWDDGRVIGLFVVFAVLLAGFGYNQHRLGDKAALPLRILEKRSVIAGFIFTTCTNSMMQTIEYYLPTYFQIVQSLTPGESGVRMVPIMLGMLIGLLIQGMGTSFFGYFKAFMICGSLLMPVASGLITTLLPTTPIARLIVYTCLAGLSGGIGFQGPQAAIQVAFKDSPGDVNVATGILLFGQNLGPAVSLAVAQVIFTNTLSTNLQTLVPGLTASTIENTGLSGITAAVPAGLKDEALAAINHSLVQTWYLAVGLGCATMIGSLLVEWRSVKEKNE